jgi:hypothetical protein
LRDLPQPTAMLFYFSWLHKRTTTITTGSNFLAVSLAANPESSSFFPSFFSQH